MASILIAVDGSEPALRAIQSAMTCIKQGLNASMHLINVQPEYITLTEHVLFNSDEIYAALKQEGEELIGATKIMVEQEGMSYSHHIEIGPIAERIVEYAKLYNFDYIFMGTRGMTATGSFLLGSNAYKVVHLSDVPVMLVK